MGGFGSSFDHQSINKRGLENGWLCVWGMGEVLSQASLSLSLCAGTESRQAGRDYLRGQEKLWISHFTPAADISVLMALLD